MIGFYGETIIISIFFSSFPLLVLFSSIGSYPIIYFSLPPLPFAVIFTCSFFVIIKSSTIFQSLFSHISIKSCGGMSNSSDRSVPFFNLKSFICIFVLTFIVTYLVFSILSFFTISSLFFSLFPVIICLISSVSFI